MICSVELVRRACLVATRGYCARWGIRWEIVPVASAPSAGWQHALLAGGERAEYDAFGSRHRRAQWLAGRAAAKSVVARSSPYYVDRRDVRVASGRAGKRTAPRITHGPAGTGTPLPGTCSISHTASLAAAAASPTRTVGIDLTEWASLPVHADRVAFTAEERALAHHGLPEWDAAVRTRVLWGLKEATSKAFGTGLRYWDSVRLADLVDAGNGIARATLDCRVPGGPHHLGAVVTTYQSHLLVITHGPDGSHPADAGSEALRGNHA